MPLYFAQCELECMKKNNECLIPNLKGNTENQYRFFYYFFIKFHLDSNQIHFLP